jgi:hypothetical protein
MALKLSGTHRRGELLGELFDQDAAPCSQSEQHHSAVLKFEGYESIFVNGRASAGLGWQKRQHGVSRERR